VINHPKAPVLIDQDVGLIAVHVVDQLIEDLHDIVFLVPGVYVGGLRVLRPALRFIHHYVIDPPGVGRRFSLKGPFHRGRNHVLDPHQPRHLPACNVEFVGVFKADFVQKELFGFVDGLDTGIVGGGSVGQGDPQGSRGALVRFFTPLDFRLAQENFLLLRRLGALDEAEDNIPTDMIDQRPSCSPQLIEDSDNIRLDSTTFEFP